ncbi:MAG: hypothetical protein K8U57_25185 [Planctomycetes bacterium]|nr:hypothetical protein [Planctomycetota bacterium]
MADTRHNKTLGTRFRFLVRAIGLTGVLAAVVGMALFASAFPLFQQWTVENLRTSANGDHGPFAKTAAWTFVIGLAAVALALVVEVIGGVLLVTGRRTVANTSATVATCAAISLLVFVNAYSFTHHERHDFTRTQQFTLPTELAGKLRSLRPESPTTIIVLQKHRIFGSLSDDRDSFTKGAEEKVTEKVKDLVDLFREFGPRFNVEVLDTEAFGYRKRVTDLTADAPELKAAIEAAPENSILFHANKRVQRLAFNEFLQLDKTSSDASHGGRGNLVLLPQGIDNFARRVLEVQERRPKVAVCVVHEWLTTAATTGRQSQFSLAGLKASLTDHGFDVIDIILKKNWESSPEPDPAAYTIQESKLERLEAEYDAARSQLRSAQNDVKIIASIRKEFDETAALPFRDRANLAVNLSRVAQIRGWSEIVKSYFQWSGGESKAISEANESELRVLLGPGLARQAIRAEQEAKDAEKVRLEAEEQVQTALKDERSIQDRRENDLKVKFAGLLKDVDLLVIPRYTVVNATVGERIEGSLHTLSKPQVEVIRDFMKSGKPVLACLGSLSGPGGYEADGSDDLEKLIAERGIELGRDTILYDVEAKAFAAMKAGRQLGAGGGADIPQVTFAEKTSEGSKAKPNPVGAAVRLTSRSVDQNLDLRLRAPRPVYLAAGWQERLPITAEFFFTAPESWNEEQPFLRRGPGGRVAAVPRYEPTLDSDVKWGTRSAEQKGPFPIGVAIESKVPASWFVDEYDREQFAGGILNREWWASAPHRSVYDRTEAAAAILVPFDGVLAACLTASSTKIDRPTERLIVFGSGNLFTGSKLDPAREKLLIHSANWLTGRADRLPRADLPQWEFPRVEMSEREFYLWRYGTAVGLPLLAVYLGLMATMLRRLR